MIDNEISALIESAFSETVAEFWGNSEQILVSACYRFVESHTRAGKEIASKGLAPFIVGMMLLKIGENRAKQKALPMRQH